METVPFSLLNDIDPDCTLRYKDKTWPCHQFWLRVNSGTLRHIPSLPATLDYTHMVPEVDVDTFDIFHSLLYGRPVVWKHPQRVPELLTLLDYLDSMHLVSERKCKVEIVRFLNGKLSLREKIQYGTQYDLPDLFDQAVDGIFQDMKSMSRGTLKERLRDVGKRKCIADDVLLLLDAVPSRGETSDTVVRMVGEDGHGPWKLSISEPIMWDAGPTSWVEPGEEFGA